MKLNFFTVPLAHPETAQAALNQFLSSQRGLPPGATRWQLDQQRQELPFSQPQRERAG